MHPELEFKPVRFQSVLVQRKWASLLWRPPGFLLSSHYALFTFSPSFPILFNIAFGPFWTWIVLYWNCILSTVVRPNRWGTLGTRGTRVKYGHRFLSIRRQVFSWTCTVSVPREHPTFPRDEDLPAMRTGSQS